MDPKEQSSQQVFREALAPGRVSLGLPPIVAGIPLIRISGDPETAARSLGAQIKDRIAATWSFYRTVFGRPEAEILELAERFAEKIRKFSSPIHAELVALAEGAEVDPRIIFALNSRTEILHLSRSLPECTSVFFNRTRILAQNWDWAEQLEDLIVLVEYEKPDGLKILTLTEPGILSKIGFNSAGIGVCLNIAGGSARADGVPVHILLRAILESRTLDQAVTRVLSAEAGTMSSILIGDASGECAVVEIHGDQLRIERTSSRPVVRTNHLLNHGPQLVTSFFSDSIDRLDRAKEIASKPGAQDLKHAQELLLDSCGTESPINAPYEPVDGIGRIGTVAHVIMDLPQRTLIIKKAGGTVENFESYTLSR